MLEYTPTTIMAQLSDAVTWAHFGAWHKILQIEPHSNAAQIEKARRTLQRSAHPDKGGSVELSQLVNKAADTLISRTKQTDNESRFAEWFEWLRQEDAARAEAKAAEAKAAAAKAAEAKAAEMLAARTAVAEAALSHQSKRGANARSKVYLSPSTRRLFPRIGNRIWVLQKKGQWEKSRCLAYAVEAEIASRRGVRETTFPKTMGLVSREPVKAQRLAALKRRYDVAYQRVRYLRGKTAGVTLARLRLAWVLREAWGVLLSQPPPVMDETVIPMEGL